MNEYTGHTEEELVEEHDRIVSLMSEVDDNIAFSKSPRGRKRVQRLVKDLAAVQNKYYSIKGNKEDMLMELVRNQGGEKHLREELSILGDAESFKKKMLSDLDLIKIEENLRKQTRTLGRG